MLPMANGVGAEARHPDEGGRGEWFLATKNAKVTKVGNGMGAVRKGHVYSLRDSGLR